MDAMRPLFESIQEPLLRDLFVELSEPALNAKLEQFLDRFVPEGNAPRKGAYAKWMQMRDASNLW